MTARTGRHTGPTHPTPTHPPNRDGYACPAITVAQGAALAGLASPAPDIPTWW